MGVLEKCSENSRFTAVAGDIEQILETQLPKETLGATEMAKTGVFSSVCSGLVL